MSKITTSELKKFITQEGKGISLMEGSIQLPDAAIVDIIMFYEKRFRDNLAPTPNTSKGGE